MQDEIGRSLVKRCYSRW